VNPHVRRGDHVLDIVRHFDNNIVSNSESPYVHNATRTA